MNVLDRFPDYDPAKFTPEDDEKAVRILEAIFGPKRHELLAAAIDLKAAQDAREDEAKKAD